MDISLNKDLVLGLRKRGLTFYEIAEKFVSPDADAKLKAKQIDKLMCMDGGIIDICLNPDDNDTDLDGMKHLVAGIVEAAINDYGEAYTAQMGWNNFAKATDISKKSSTMIEVEHFLDSELAKAYFAIMDGDMNTLDSKTILPVVRKQAQEGRWIRFTKYKFKTKHDILEFASKYPKYSCMYEIRKVKKSDWRFFNKKREEVVA